MTGGVLIIGAGQAGGRAAIALREEGYGGPITLVGDEPVAPYERPPLSKDVLLGLAAPEDAPVNPPSAYADAHVDLRLGTRVRDVDLARRHARLADGSELAFDHVIFATGVRPRRLSVPGGDHPRIRTLRNADDARRLRDGLGRGAGRLVVIGGGFIGLEVAAAACRLGWSVTVLEAASACLGRVLPAPSVEPLIALHEAEGVRIVCGAGVVAILDEDGAPVVVLADGSRRPADLVVAGVGSVPNMEVAAAAGAACADGILVDAHCRASLPGAYAIGDVAQAPSKWFGRSLRLESWDHAERQGQQVARTIVHGDLLPDTPPWFWTDQYGCNLQVLGAPAAHDDLVVRRGRGPDDFVHFYRRDGRISGAVLFNSGRERRAIAQLIIGGAPCSAADLADSGVNLRQIA